MNLILILLSVHACCLGFMHFLSTRVFSARRSNETNRDMLREMKAVGAMTMMMYKKEGTDLSYFPTNSK